MVAPDTALERRALRVSIVMSTTIGGLGIVIGLVAASQTVLLDGAYAFVGVVVTWLALLVSRLVARGPTKDYPYGREALTPLVVAVQGFVLFGVIAYASVDAVLTIRDGGADVSAGAALAYAVASTVLAVVTWRWLARRAAISDLIRAEVAGWQISAVLGAGMVVGFVVLLVLKDSSWSAAAPYVDPVMLIVLSCVMVPAPLAMVRSTLVELLEGAPGADVQSDVRAVVVSVHTRRELPVPEVQMTKLGAKLYVDVEGLAPSSFTLSQEQQLREEVEAALDAMPFDVWLSYQLLPEPPDGRASVGPQASPPGGR
jgi:predicted Co/Zn/Cd cation transporter (cation efflux family)